ncbi:hypothetical protein CRU98_05655 [Arcobacter sp. CECT 8986]|uniref:hypothetical protein n=1 Tax=Arcobacter sp. CECT 8986 TaxID=2044507 RepID=UPI001009C118|nr:hypothetical protein [Arcobacter sp. CECT 8986]RXJ99512.1 hypothetical protein CRU98_05655 [Arcobacter sp. CECT 8986]
MDSIKLAEKYNKKAPANKKKSKLDKHNEAIKYLLDNNHSLLSVQNFLESECKCKVAYSTLRDYCNRRFNNKSETEQAAKKYEEIKSHCANLRKNFFSEEEKTNIKSIVETIDYFVKKSFNSNTKNTPDNLVNVSNETASDDAISDYAKVANMRKENKFG